MTTPLRSDHRNAPPSRTGWQGWAADWMEWIDWMDSVFPLFPVAIWRGLGYGRTIRCDEDIEDDRYVLRAELPGIDPDTDLDVSVSDRVLSITVSGSRDPGNGQHTGSSSGRVTRSVPLPPGAETSHISATYQDGVLEVSVPLSATASARTVVPVTRTG